MKKLLIGFAVLLVLLLGAMVSIPYFFKDEIVAAIKKAANDELTAQLDFESVDISLFREFPKLAVGLKNLSVINGPGPFANVPLLKTKQLDVAVDLWAAIFDNNIIIKGLSIDEPEMKVYALSNGAANYDITKPAPPTTTTESSPIKLEYYEIKNGNILYDDRGLDMVMEMKGDRKSVV